jgi:hypothetical protein
MLYRVLNRNVKIAVIAAAESEIGEFDIAILTLPFIFRHHCPNQIIPIWINACAGKLAVGV